MRQKLNRQSEIYNKALELFIEKGYNGTSMLMIAKALGMTKANLYYYCSNKENLFYRIHLDYVQKHLIPIVEEAEQIPDPIDRIAFVLKRQAILNTTDKATRVLIPDIANLDRGHHNEIILVWRKMYEIVYNSIKELQALGKANKFRESFLTFLGFGMANWTVYWFDFGRRVNAEEYVETLVQTFMNGLLRPITEKGYYSSVVKSV